MSNNKTTVAEKASAPVTTPTTKTAAEVANNSNIQLKNPMVPLSSLEAGLNVRVDFGNMEELTESISQAGLFQPLTVRSGKNGKWIVTDGHRRLKALQSIAKEGFEFDGIPVVIESDMKEEDLLLGLLIHNDGKPLNMLEQAEVFNRLEKKGWTTGKIGKMAGKTAQHIRDCQLLSKAGTKLIDMVNKGVVSPTNVVLAMRKSGGDVKKASELMDEMLGRATAKGKGKVSAKELKTATNNKPISGTKGESNGSVRTRINEVLEVVALNEKKPQFSQFDIVNLMQWLESGEGELVKILKTK